MKNMTLENIAKACGGQLFGENKQLEIENVVTDSRQAEKNDLFIAIRGEKTDGHKFIPQVLEKGAAALCEVAPETSQGSYIVVQDVLKALRDIAEFYRSMLQIPVIGITGSVGKTSAKECVAGVLAQKYDVLKTEGNYNNEIGVPLTLLKIREHHQAAVVEMGINHFGEMHRLSQMAKPDLVVMTNIGQCHLEFLGDRDGVLRAKSEIFDFLQDDGTVIVNGDDDKLITVKQVKGKPVVTYGKESTNAFYGELLEDKGLFGSKFLIHTPEECFEAEIPLPGQHMMYNALAAAAVGKSLGLTKEEIVAGIASVKPTNGRCNIIPCKDRVLIDDCYNANPVSTCAAIDLLEKANTRKVAILGDMFELGEDADKMHAGVGEYAVEMGIHVLVCVGQLSENMAKAARAFVEKEKKDTKVFYFKEKAAMLSEIDGILEPGDTVLMKASHGMGFAEVVEKLKD